MNETLDRFSPVKGFCYFLEKTLSLIMAST